MTTLGGIPGFYGTADGAGSIARFSNPRGIAVDGEGNLYVADFYFNTIRKGHPPARILNSGVVAGRCGFNLTAPPGHSLVVEASTDLGNWLPLSTNTIGANALHLSDLQSGLHPIRFYRARLP